jgi:flagellar M-ring protein FliF
MPQDFLAQIKKIADALSMKQKVMIGVAAIAAIVGVMSFSRWQRESDFKPLYTSMAGEDAGAIVAKLKENGVEYRVIDNGGTVLVPSSKVGEARIQMASAGLPKSGRIGYELFDQTNFGVSDFAEQVNYRRALEGELERSIKAISEISSARVHLALAKDSVFLEARLPAKASVLIGAKSGMKISPQNVTAITHMVASAVEGLTPDMVSVTNESGQLLSKPHKAMDNSEASDEAMEYRQRLERDLLAKINSTLQPLVGMDKFRAGVSVECDFSSGEQSEETFDPDKSVITNSQKSEETTASSAGGAGGGGGVPGTASNLPRPPARSVSGNSSLSRRTENVSYQTSKTVRRVKLPQGAVKKISASVVLDQAVRWEGSGVNAKRILVPPSADNLRAIRELVVGAIGFSTTRGDQLVIESLPFEATLLLAAPNAPQQAPAGNSGPGGIDFNDKKVQIIGGSLGLLLLVALAIGFVMLRKKKKAKAQARKAIDAITKQNVDMPTVPVLEGAEQQLALAEASLTGQPKLESLLDRVRGSIDEDPVLAANVLRTWLGAPR